MPSLLAALQLGHETDCVGRLVSVDWSTGGAHPYSYRVEDITAERCVLSVHCKPTAHLVAVVGLCCYIFSEMLRLLMRQESKFIMAREQ